MCAKQKLKAFKNLTKELTWILFKVRKKTLAYILYCKQPFICKYTYCKTSWYVMLL